MNKFTGPLLNEVQPDRVESRIAPSLERRRLRAYILMLLIDAILINLSFAFAAFAYEGRWWEPRSMLVAQTLVPLYLTIATIGSTRRGRRSPRWRCPLPCSISSPFTPSRMPSFRALR